MSLQDDHIITEIQPLLELRIFAYGVLRRAFCEEPSKELVQQLKNGIISEFPFKDDHQLIKEGVRQVEGYLNTYKAELDFESLHWDYTQMFIGPYKLPAPIWESSYVNEDKLLFQEETRQVRRAYLKYCFLPNQEGREAEDHLGFELDFMYQLSKLSFDQATCENINKSHDTLLDQYLFLKDHLLVWTPTFRENVCQHAKTDFYKGMVKILSGFLIIDESCTDQLLTVTKRDLSY